MFHHSIKILKKWCKEGRTSQLNLWERLPVGFDNICNSINLWFIVTISIDRETMAYSFCVHMPWYTTETEERELLVGVIRLDDSSDIVDGSLVLIVPPQVV